MISEPVSIPMVVDINQFDLLNHVTQIAEDNNEAPHQNLACSADVWLSIFFDGTGNNRNVEMKKPSEQSAFSNVAKLYAVHRIADVQEGIGLEYIRKREFLPT